MNETSPLTRLEPPRSAYELSSHYTFTYCVGSSI